MVNSLIHYIRDMMKCNIVGCMGVIRYSILSDEGKGIYNNNQDNMHAL